MRVVNKEQTGCLEAKTVVFTDFGLKRALA
jgi:hypothetical protein